MELDTVFIFGQVLMDMIVIAVLCGVFTLLLAFILPFFYTPEEVEDFLNKYTL